jgi:hypothetical protein
VKLSFERGINEHRSTDWDLMRELEIVGKRLVFKENYVELAFKFSDHYTLLNRSKT